MRLAARLLRRPGFWVTVGLIGIDTAYFTLTNPSKIVSMGLMAGFLLLAVSTYCLFSVLLSVAKLYGVAVGVNRHRAARYATGLTAGLFALRSVGELSLRDALVLVPLTVILYVYVSYGRLKSEHKTPDLGV